MNSSNSNQGLKPGVSVVVCCYNSSSIITPTITALCRQEVPENCGYEVILVDNNCTDDTIELARKAWKNSEYRLKILKETRPGLIHARKTGVKSALYNILLFVDDDNILNPDWVPKLYSLFQRMSEVGIIGGYNQALISGEKPVWFDRYQRVYACGPRDEQSRINPKFLYGAGLAFRSSALKFIFSSLPSFLVGRTNNTLSRGEDTEISLKCRLMGWKAYYDSSLSLLHNLPSNRLTWDYICRARKGGGYARLILMIYQRLLHKKEPWSYSQCVRYVIREWREFFAKNFKTIFFIRKAGSETSYSFYRMVGLTAGLIKYYRTYDTIRKKIQESLKFDQKKDCFHASLKKDSPKNHKDSR